MSRPDPVLLTAVIGSYSMPGWLERAKNDYLHRRLSRHDLEEIHDAAVKAAIKDQETAGVDNMIDHFTTRLPGVQIDHTSKKFYYDFYDAAVRGRLPTGSLGLVEEFRFLRRYTERRTKVSVTGPLSLVKRIRNEYYPSEEALALDLVPAKGLAVNPDCGLMHLPRDVAFAKLNAMVEGTRLVRAELGG